MSVQAFTGEQLELAGIGEGRDLGIMVPNVVLNPGSLGELGLSAVIRGLPGVTTYVDGAWVDNLGFLQRSFVETERIEILRGPQGTLFGRNTNGGAIQIVTRKPADAFGVRLHTRIGDYDRRTLTVAADVPISDRLKTKWTAAIDKSNGFMPSRSAALALGDEDNSLVRGDVLWQPSDRFSLRFNLSQEDRHGSAARIIRFTNPQHPELVAYNVLAGNPDYLSQARAIDPTFPDPPFPLATDRFTAQTHQSGFPGGELGRWETRSTSPGTTIVDQRFALLTLDWDVTRRFKLESLTGHMTSDALEGAGFDGSELTLLSGLERDHADLTTQELHLIGRHLNGRLQTLIGLYYSDLRPWTRTYLWDEWEFAVPNTGPNPPLQNQAALAYVHAWGAAVGNDGVANFSPWTWNSIDVLAGGTNFDRALFGQVQIGVTPKLDVTLGFRFTTHDGDSTRYVPAESFRPARPDTVAPGDPFAAAGVLLVAEDPKSGTASTPRLAISYQATDDVYVYASQAEGFTSAVLAPAQDGRLVLLNPEVARTREVGIRSNWLGDRLRLNATYFDSHWDGFRVPKIDESTGLPVPTSDGVGRASGLEVELSFRPRERWELDVAVGLLDTEYLALGDPPANGSGLQSGTPFAYAPKSSYTLALRYRLPLDRGGELQFAGSYGWMDEYQRAASNERQTKNPDGSDKPEPAYGILNARIAFKPAHRDWQLALFGTNLTNEWYVNGGFDARAFAGYDFGTIGRPREVGVDLRWAFQ